MKKRYDIRKIKKVLFRWFNESKKVFSIDKKLSKEMILELLEFCRKKRVRIPKSIKRFICKRCKTLLIPGKNLRVRLKDAHLVYKCKECNFIMRYPYLKEKKNEKD